MKLIKPQSGWCGNQCAAVSVCIRHTHFHSCGVCVCERDVVLKEEKQESPAALQHFTWRKWEGFGARRWGWQGVQIPTFASKGTSAFVILGQARHTLLMRHWLIQLSTLTFLLDTCFHRRVCVSEWMKGGKGALGTWNTHAVTWFQLTHKTTQAKQIYACFVPPGPLS